MASSLHFSKFNNQHHQGYISILLKSYFEYNPPFKVIFKQVICENPSSDHQNFVQPNLLCMECITALYYHFIHTHMAFWLWWNLPWFPGVNVSHSSLPYFQMPPRMTEVRPLTHALPGNVVNFHHHFYFETYLLLFTFIYFNRY